MPIEWTWYNEQRTIICFTFQDPWTLEEFLIADQHANHAVAQLDWTVDAILDLCHTTSFPRDIVSGMLNSIKRSTSSPNIGSSVVININPVFTTFIRVIQRLAPKDKVLMAEDFEGAIRIIASLQAERPSTTNYSDD